MSKSYASPAAGSAQVEARAATTSPAVEATPSNELLVGLMAQAGAQETGQASMLDLAMSQSGPAPDAGMFDIPEGKDQPTPLPGVRDKHQATVQWADPAAKMTPFVKGATDKAAVDPNDVAQGSLGNCYFIASMVAVARANPDAIKQLIRSRGDGTYDVTLYVRDSAYGSPKAVTQVVDPRMPLGPSGSPLYAKVGDQKNGTTEIWSSLLEKRLAMQKGSYDKISGGNIAKDGFAFAGATELLTGKRESYRATTGMKEDDVLLEIAAALEGKKPVTVDSKDMTATPDLAKEAEAHNVYGNHAYAPSKVDLEARTIDLTNPWGSDHVTGLSVKDFLRFYRGVRVGA